MGANYVKLLRCPLVLVPSVFPHCYQGGKLRAQFFGEPNPKDDKRPEGWFFSTNKAMTPGRTNEPHEGIGRVALPEGGTVLLTELIEQFFPKHILGNQHILKFGKVLGILVKIFDTASYIPVHWHPDREFAQEHLHSPFGKTEAWIIIATRKNAKVWVGWNRQITRKDITEWWTEQNGNAMRSCMFIYEPEIGDIFYIPAGVPHSLIGCCVLEPQEPTDWSIFAEWKMLGLPNAEAGLSGLDWQTALDSLTFDYLNKERFESEVFMKPRAIWTEGGNNECDILPEGTQQFFGASRLTVKSEVKIRKDGFYGLVVTSGSGYLRGFGSDLYLKPGVTLMMPHCLSDTNYTIVGNPSLQLFFFYPPLS